SVLSASVERLVLTDSIVVRGTVTADQTVPVIPLAGGEGAVTPIVTKLPVTAGAGISGRPVIALRSSLPMYRDLKPGMRGEDVERLQQALSSAGHSTGGDAEGTFGPGTGAALTSLYAALGYEPLPALSDGDEQLRAAQATVTAARQALEEAPEDGTLRAENELAAAQRKLTDVTAETGPMLPVSEAVFLGKFPARVDSVGAGLGSRASGTAMTLSTGDLVVTGTVDDHQKSLVRKGQKVEIYSETTGRTVTATVSSVAGSPGERPSPDGGGTLTDDNAGDTADGTEGSTRSEPAAAAPGRQSGYRVTVKPDKKLDPAMTGLDVRLTVEAATTDRKVLAVPLSAVTAGADRL
ncbi:peptidoglycan-binding protein, partial [Streptomyces sp. NPDC048279]|uniref:peptidoglycan-binding protein n=1 Tax=Streptomyces sp. NPDC048279 TaxID=3154714 RepID=UPI003436DB7E